MRVLSASLNVLQRNRNASRRLTIACALLVAFAAAPVHAQYIYQDLYDFNQRTIYGDQPFDFGYLTEGADLYLYGTTKAGGANGCGTVFKVSPDGASIIKLWDFPYSPDFNCDDVSALTLANDGYFYGTTADANSGLGTLFRIGSSPGSQTILHNFDNTEGGGAVQPIQAKDGNLYGVTGNGITYRFNLVTQTYELLTNSTPGPTSGPLVLASNGDLYGASWCCGTSGNGTIFSIATPSGAVKVIHNFTGADGQEPRGPLVALPNPRCKPAAHCVLLYGTTISGGANNNGVVFEVSPSGALNVLHSFGALSSNQTNSDGASPWAGLLLAPNGQLLGVTMRGGISHGTIFQISTAGSFTKLFDFTGPIGPQSGGNAWNTLMQHTNGCFYGLTLWGANGGSGNLYNLCPPGPLGPIPILIVEGPIFVPPGIPVEIIGSNMAEVSTIAFGGVEAQIQIQPGSDTFLFATVPLNAVDGVVTATFPSGAQVQSEKSMYILPLITNLDPTSGPLGQDVDIVGGGFSGATRVAFGGVRATNFTVLSPSLIQATVPTEAKTGKVTVTTPNGTATSKQTFTVN